MFPTKCKEHDHSSFFRFLQMENNHKDTDCYFFYYSTCKKGDSCLYRHEPTALGCETMCPYWQQGICFNEHCNFRHMELKKNRKLIPCYWETQPSGCRKPHCSFMHKNARGVPSDPINPVKTGDSPTKPTNQETSIRQDDTKFDGSGTESDPGRGSSEAGSFIGSPAVDPLIVKFEEESDNESTPSPKKPQRKVVPYCKTYEEIRLEEIQAESAAFYSYQADDFKEDIGGGKAKKVSTARSKRKVSLYTRVNYNEEREEERRKKSEDNGETLDFQVMTLEQIRRRRELRSIEELIDSKLALNFASSTPAKGSGRADATTSTEHQSTTNLLKDAIKNLSKLTSICSTRQNARKRKSDNSAACTSEEERIAENTWRSSASSAIPPVKLKRSRNYALQTENEPSSSKKHRRIITELREERKSEADETSAGECTTKENVQVGICDSSTDNKEAAASSRLPKSLAEEQGNGRMEEECTERPGSLVDSKQICDSLLNVNDEEILLLDVHENSDDILNDIDALLTDKSET